MVSRNKLRFETLFRPILKDLVAILEHFGKPKLTPKSIFGLFYVRCFFECDLISILIGFLEARNLVVVPEENLIFIKLTFSKKLRKIDDFSFTFGGPNNGNSIKNYVQKHDFFSIGFCTFFFFGFWRFGLDFGRPRGLQKSTRN